MARAYENRQHKEDRDSSCTSVATQTDRGMCVTSNLYVKWETQAGHIFQNPKYG